MRRSFLHRLFTDGNFFCIVLLCTVCFVLSPSPTSASGLSSASATLSNPRLSFQGRVSTNYSAGASVFEVDTTAGVSGDISTEHLFPNDNFAIGPNGNLQVASISSNTVFTSRLGLTTGVTTNTSIYATQSGTMTVNFYTGAAVPVGGSILVKIPASNGTISGGTNDGAPDTTNALNTNGFDLNGITSSNITCPAGFTAGAVTIGAGGLGNQHLITCNYNGASAVPSGANFSVVIGSTSRPLVNPAPINTGRVKGTADVYKISIATTNGSDGTGSEIESVDTRAAAIEGVLITANIDESLSFTVSGVTDTSGTICGITRTSSSIPTTATSVPWGYLTSNYTSDKNNAAQRLTVTTNSPSGYTVYAEENDQMVKEGNICSGGSAAVEPFSYGSSPYNYCIRDYNKSGASSTVSSDWTNTPGTDYGLGYSLENVSGSGTDATFLYNESSRAFSAKHFADQEASQNKYASGAQLMSNVGLVSGSSVYVCYRIHIPGTQPAGYYFNKVKYTAVAKF